MVNRGERCRARPLPGDHQHLSAQDLKVMRARAAPALRAAPTLLQLSLSARHRSGHRLPWRSRRTAW